MIIRSFLQKSLAFAKVGFHPLFGKRVLQAQKVTPEAASRSYSEMFAPHVGGFSIAMDVTGKQMDSYQFASLLKDRSDVRFFIGGAYGLERKFVQQCQQSISLSPLTFSHKIAAAVLMEQIYRGLCITHNHPYHKP